MELEVHGAVTEERTGAPLAGVTVSIDAFGVEAVTEADGSYLIRTWQRALDRLTGVHAFGSGFLPEQRYLQLGCHAVVTLAGEPVVCRMQVDFWMQPSRVPASRASSCAITGRVWIGWDDDPGPAYHAVVRVEGTDLIAFTDSAGAYEIQSVPAGMQRITARYGSAPRRRLIDVSCTSPTEALPLSFRLSPGLVIS